MNDTIKSYSDYCLAFKAESQLAKDMFAVRNWTIEELKSFRNISNGNSIIGLDDLESIEYIEMKSDALSFIVHESIDNFFRLYDHMREKSARENIIMPIQKAKEINNSTIIWLCKQPGRTAREKIGNSNNRIKAVNRFMSNDTLENRLLVACAKTLCACIKEKMIIIGEEHCRHEEILFLNKTNTFLKSSIVSNISKWNNTPPNNALLSDKNYKKIWIAWTRLKELDDVILHDSENLIENVFTVFTVELIAEIKKHIFLPQLPVMINYDEQKVCFFQNTIHGCDKNGIAVIISIRDDCVEIEYKGEKRSFNKTDIYDLCVLAPDMLEAFRKVFSDLKLFSSGTVQSSKVSELPFSEKKYIDIISVIPEVSCAEYGSFDNELKMIYQEFTENDKKKDVILPCFGSDILISDNLTRIFTIKSAAEHERADILQKIFSSSKKYFNCSSLSMMINDGYDAFQLKNYKKTARSFFNNVELFPESIGTVFWYQNCSGQFQNTNSSEIVIVANIIENSYSLTPVCSVYEEDTKRCIWERYPTALHAIPDLEKIKAKLENIGCPHDKAEDMLNDFGLRSLDIAFKKLMFEFQDREVYSFDEAVSWLTDSICIDITENVDTIIAEMFRKKETESCTVHVIVLSDFVKYSGKYTVINADMSDVIAGAQYHDKVYDEINNMLQKSKRQTLWRDHLPDLSIKRLFGEFPLVKNARTDPILGKKQRIKIDSIFTLPAGKDEYHFKLIQNDNGTDMRYEAVIKNDAFPLKHDTNCRLNMYYQYDADDMYTLEFVPINMNTAEFITAKVEFAKTSALSSLNLPSPPFPPVKTWEELYEIGSYGTTSIIDCVLRILNNLQKSMNQERYLIREFDIGRLLNEEDIIQQLEINGELQNVSIRKRNCCHQSDLYEGIGSISFLLSEPFVRDDVYEVELSDFDVFWKKDAFFINDIWFDDRYYDKISFFKDNFKDQEQFNEYIEKVTFVIKQNQKGYWIAKNICVLDNKPQIDYYANNIQINSLYDDSFFMRTDKNGKNFITKSMYAFHKLYCDCRTVRDEACSDELRCIVKNVAEQLPVWYRNIRTDPKFDPKQMLYKFMCIMAKDMPDSCYELLNELVDGYKTKKNKLPDFIGYALGDLKYSREIELLNNIITLKKSKVICILANVLWKNQGFLYAFDMENAFYFFDYAVESCIKFCEKETGGVNPGVKVKDFHSFLEYILAIFRLRELNNPVINNKLSLNNPQIQRLYRALELLDATGIKLRTILDFRLKQEDDKHDKLIYALVCYITGDMGEDDIIISGLNDTE